MKRVNHIVFACASVLLGCEQTNQTAEQIKELSKQVESLLPSVQSSADKSLSEFKKLHQVQYRVLSLPANVSDKTIEQKLNSLGEDGWDCSPSLSTPDLSSALSSADSAAINKQAFRFFCKRPVETPLRYLPGGFMGDGR